MSRLRPVMQLGADAWATFAENVDEKMIVKWIKVLCLCEERFFGFECGPRSPVIFLARELRKRGRYPKDLTLWIRNHSSNKFLPYGSLSDML